MGTLGVPGGRQKAQGETQRFSYPRGLLCPCLLPLTLLALGEPSLSLGNRLHMGQQLMQRPEVYVANHPLGTKKNPWLLRRVGSGERAPRRR